MGLRIRAGGSDVFALPACCATSALSGIFRVRLMMEYAASHGNCTDLL